jgi:hypothetical protein
VQPVPGRNFTPRNNRPRQGLIIKPQGGADSTLISNKSSSTDMDLAWSCSQFGATSTQLNEVNKSQQGPVGPASNAEPSRQLSSSKVQALTKNTVILNSVNKPSSASPANTFVKPGPKPVKGMAFNAVRAIPTTQSSKVPQVEPGMDMSISDDLLATLAEPDDLLDSQACLALLESPDKQNPTSSQASTVVFSDFEANIENNYAAVSKVPEPTTGSMDHLECFLLEPKRGKSAPKGKVKENTGNVHIV